MQYPFSYSKDPHVDLSSHDAFNEGAPFATFDRMRREDRVAWCEEKDGRGFWSITRHEDLMVVNKNVKVFSSAKGIRIEDQTEEEYEARKKFLNSPFVIFLPFLASLKTKFKAPSFSPFSIRFIKSSA